MLHSYEQVTNSYLFLGLGDECVYGIYIYSYLVLHTGMQCNTNFLFTTLQVRAPFAPIIPHNIQSSKFISRNGMTLQVCTWHTVLVCIQGLNLHEDDRSSHMGIPAIQALLVNYSVWSTSACQQSVNTGLYGSCSTVCWCGWSDTLAGLFLGMVLLLE